MLIPTIPQVDYDIIEEKVDGSIITKKVLYKKNGTVIVFATTQVKVVDEVAKIDTQIAVLQDQKESLVQSAQEMKIDLTPIEEIK